MSKKPTKQDTETHEAKKYSKFRFQNIGPITDAHLELGDLTIIAGANNTGKTYIAYTLYGLLKYMSNLFYMPNASESYIARMRKIMNIMNIQLLSHQHETRNHEQKILDIEFLIQNEKIIVGIANMDDIHKFVTRTMQIMHDNFSQNIGEIFSTSRQEFLQSEAKIKISFAEPIDIKEKFGSFETLPDNRVRIAINKQFINVNDDIPFETRLDIMIKTIIIWFFILRRTPEPFILSAERFGISLFYKELDFTKSRVVEVLQKLKDDKNLDARKAASLINSSTARYAKPIKDNIDYTRDLEATQKEKGELSDSKLHEYVKDIVGGYYRYENDTIYFISKQRKDGAFKIPLHLASSAAREMSDVYFYLKHVARKGELLIIDEPESHLNTKNQILMARLLARCVNAGLRVLITTHSDYIIKELNNLIMLSANFPQKAKFLNANKKQYTKEDFLKQESVRAYICENGGLTPCKMNSRGMLMPSFDDTIIDINRISDFLDSYLPEEA